MIAVSPRSTLTLFGYIWLMLPIAAKCDNSYSGGDDHNDNRFRQNNIVLTPQNSQFLNPNKNVHFNPAQVYDEMSRKEQQRRRHQSQHQQQQQQQQQHQQQSETNLLPQVLWEEPLKFAAYMTLLPVGSEMHRPLYRENETPKHQNRIDDPQMLSALYKGAFVPVRDFYVPQFGDIIMLAKGVLEMSDGDHQFVFRQTAGRVCLSTVCKDDQQSVVEQKNITAFWTVEKIRHKDEQRGHRYELKVSVFPTVQHQHLPSKSFILRDDDYPAYFEGGRDQVRQPKTMPPKQASIDRTFFDIMELIPRPFMFTDIPFHLNYPANGYNLNLGEIFMPTVALREPTLHYNDPSVSDLVRPHSAETTRSSQQLRFPEREPPTDFYRRQPHQFIAATVQPHSRPSPPPPPPLARPLAPPLTPPMHQQTMSTAHHLHHHYYMTGNHAAVPHVHTVTYNEQTNTAPHIPFHVDYRAAHNMPKQQISPFELYHSDSVRPQQHFVNGNTILPEQHHRFKNAVHEVTPPSLMQPLQIPPNDYRDDNDNANSFPTSTTVYRGHSEPELNLKFSEPDPIYHPNGLTSITSSTNSVATSSAPASAPSSFSSSSSINYNTNEDQFPFASQQPDIATATPTYEDELQQFNADFQYDPVESTTTELDLGERMPSTLQAPIQTQEHVTESEPAQQHSTENGINSVPPYFASSVVTQISYDTTEMAVVAVPTTEMPTNPTTTTTATTTTVSGPTSQLPRTRLRLRTTSRPVLKWLPKRRRLDNSTTSTPSTRNVLEEPNLSDHSDNVMIVTPSSFVTTENYPPPTKQSVSTSVSFVVGNRLDQTTEDTPNNRATTVEPFTTASAVEMTVADLQKVQTNSTFVEIFRANADEATPVDKHSLTGLTQSIVDHAVETVARQ